jgi:hypothetical protein
MSTNDHNETLAGIHLAIGVFLVLGVVVSPRVIGHRERMQAMVIISAILLPVALLMFSTAFALHRKNPLGRKLALWSISVLFMVSWPAAIYGWWFLHSDGAKQMYGKGRIGVIAGQEVTPPRKVTEPNSPAAFCLQRMLRPRVVDLSATILIRYLTGAKRSFLPSV